MPRKNYRLTPEEFKEKVNQLAEMSKELVKISLAVAKLPTGKKANVPVRRDGVLVKKTLGRRDLIEIRNDYASQVKELEKYFRHSAGSGGKAGKSSFMIGRGFGSLVYVDDVLRDFAQRADFGDPKLSSGLVCLTEAAVSSRATLTALFALYAKHQKLFSLSAHNLENAEEQNGNVLGSDALIDELFGEELDGIGKGGATIQAGKSAILPVSRKDFSYATLATLVGMHIYDAEQEDLSAEQKEILKVAFVKKKGFRKLTPDDAAAPQIELQDRSPMSPRQHALQDYELVKRVADERRAAEPTRKRKPRAKRRKTGKTPKKTPRREPA